MATVEGPSYFSWLIIDLFVLVAVECKCLLNKDLGIVRTILGRYVHVQVHNMGIFKYLGSRGKILILLPQLAALTISGFRVQQITQY